MTLPASGAISLANVQTEFGGANPIALSEYYDGGTYVASDVQGTIPASGTISLGNFHSAANIVISLTYTATGSSTSNTLVIPASAQAGDLAIIVGWASYPNDQALGTTTPSGFTALIDAWGSTDNWTPDQAARHHIFYKILTSGDPGSTVYVDNYHTSALNRVLIFRPNRSISWVGGISSGAQVVGNADPSPQTVYAASTGYAAVAIALGASNNWLTPPYVKTPSFPGMTLLATDYAQWYYSDPDWMYQNQYVYYRAYAYAESRSNFSIDIGYYNNGYLSGLSHYVLAVY